MNEKTPLPPLKIEKRKIFEYRIFNKGPEIDRALKKWKETPVENFTGVQDPTFLKELERNRDVRNALFEQLFDTGDCEIFIQMLIPNVNRNVEDSYAIEKTTLEEEGRLMGAIELLLGDTSGRKKVIKLLGDAGLLNHPTWIRGSYPWYKEIYKNFGDRT